jgi:hypothetical protein
VATKKSTAPSKASSTTANNPGGGGMIAKFINLDDIPDGLPPSPSQLKQQQQQQQKQHSAFPSYGRNKPAQHGYGDDDDDDNDNDGDDDDGDDDGGRGGSGYDGRFADMASSRVSPARPAGPAFSSSKPPPLPHEELHRPAKDYPSLPGSEKKGMPMVYPKVHNSPTKLSMRRDVDWDDDDDDDDGEFPDYGGYSGNSNHHTPDSRGSSSNSSRHRAAGAASTAGHAAPYHSKQPSQPLRDHPSQPHRVAAPAHKRLSSDGPPKLPSEAVAARQPEPAAPEREMTEKERLYFSKQPRPVDYKPYTLGQYKQIKPKEYVEIDPHLKPDLNNDALLAKRANAERVKEFSKQLKDFNRNVLQEQRKLPYSSEAVGIEITKKRLESNRERALQFAKQVPKPKAKGGAEGAGATAVGPRGRDYDDYGNGRGGRGGGGGNGYGDDDDDDDAYDDSYVVAPEKFGPSYESATRLQELQAKHNDNRRNIQSLKKALGV